MAILDTSEWVSLFLLLLQVQTDLENSKGQKAARGLGTGL